MTDESIPSRLKALRTRAGLSIREMAREAGMESSGYNHYEARFKGAYLPRDKAEAFASVLSRHGIDAGEVLALSGQSLASAADTHSDQLVPVYDVAASAGYGALIDREDVIDRLAFPPDYLARITSTNPRHLAVISVKGDSMLPTLRDDDVVMIDTTKTSPAFDGLAVLEIDGALHVKRLARGTKSGLVSVLSDNPSYPSREYPFISMRVVGKVLWSGRKE